MINIDYSSFRFKIKQENNTDFVYDDIRKCWIVLTPEEWVRQNFIKYLTINLQYPSSLIAIEKEIKLKQKIHQSTAHGGFEYYGKKSTDR